MKLELFHIVRTRTFKDADGEKYSAHTVYRSTPSKEFAQDLLEELYDTVLPERAQKRGVHLVCYDWMNDECFEFGVYGEKDGVRELHRFERYEIVRSEVEIRGEHI